MRSDAGAVPVRWQEVREGRDEWERVESEVIEEALITIFVNGQELASILCTPRDQDVLALGPPGPGACTRPPFPMGRSSWSWPKISAVTIRLIDCRASA